MHPHIFLYIYIYIYIYIYVFHEEPAPDEVATGATGASRSTLKRSVPLRDEDAESVCPAQRKQLPVDDGHSFMRPKAQLAIILIFGELHISLCAFRWAVMSGHGTCLRCTLYGGWGPVGGHWRFWEGLLVVTWERPLDAHWKLSHIYDMCMYL